MNKDLNRYDQATAAAGWNVLKRNLNIVNVRTYEAIIVPSAISSTTHV